MNYLISKFSHELRNPLTSLYSAVQLIESKHPEVKEYKYWPCLREDIQYMRRLLDEFSDLSKSEVLYLSTFSLYELVEQISLSFAATIVDSNVEYTSKIDPSMQQITGDKTKLQEVFRNLLKNAFDASLPDKSICLEVSQTETHTIIKVSDTGCGMSKEQLDTILEPFVTYKKEGTGLGLPICDKIVRAHGGEMTFTSAPEKGTTVTVTIPLSLSLL